MTMSMSFGNVVLAAALLTAGLRADCCPAETLERGKTEVVIATNAPKTVRFAAQAVQLDLARQKETVTFVKDYLRRVSSVGYNTVVLYLEDRVKTSSYPYSSDEDSYSLAEMKDIVATARGLGVDLVPVVSPLGHTDRFLRHKELQPFAETYGCEGRYASGYKAFCLENPAARAWMERYLDEVMEVFPGKNFHMGFDETDDLGFCPRCRPILRQKGLGHLFVKHLLWAHGIARRHGKRMWIWDDYFMFFPEMLEKVPRDVVMCAWNYCADLETTGLRNNFGCRLRRDVLREYGKLGLDSLVCPWFDTDNIVRIADYAAGRNCLGVLQTQWEMGNDFHGCFFPRVLASAALMRGEEPTFGDRWLATGVRAALPSLSEEGVNAVVTLFADQSRMRLRPLSWQQCRDAGVPVSSVSAWKGALAVLRRAQSRPGIGAVPADPLGEAGLLDDIVTRTEIVVHLAEARNAARYLTDPVRQADASRNAKARLAALLPRWRELNARRVAQWRMWRPGLANGLSSFEESLVKFVSEAQAIPDVAPEGEWLLEADVVMADAYGVPRWLIEGRFGAAWRVLAQGTWKPPAGAPAYLAKRLPVMLDEHPTELRVVYSGYGAGELCHVSLYNRSGRIVPVAVLSSSDGVRDADNLLVDDFRRARFGNPDCTAAILDPEIAARTDSVVLRLGSVN